MDKDRQIKIKDAYLQMIIDIGFDYDGYEKAESLKNLIDELCAYAKLALENNDKEAIYISTDQNGKEVESNILMEDLN